MKSGRTIKRILCLLLALVLGLGLCACGGSPEATTVPATTVPSTTGGTEPAPEPTTRPHDIPESVYDAKIPVLELVIDESKGSIADMNQDPEHETRCTGEMKLHIPAGYTCEYGGQEYQEAVTETYALDYIRGRGNSTWSASKKPYRLKLEDKADLLGMGAEKNWVLLANYYDCTMLRNKLTYRLGQEFFPEGTFVPQNVFVQVVMNDQYLGLYCLSENVRLGKQRINEDEPNSDPDASEKKLTGGYILNLEIMNDDDAVNVVTDRNQFQLDTPEKEDLTEQQLAYITNYLQQLEQRIYGPESFTDGKTYADFLDLDSYIDNFLIQELSRNQDGYRSSSTYLYQTKDGVLMSGPLWDFDYVAWSGNLSEPEGFENVDYAPWLPKLLEDESFRTKLLARWEELKPLVEEMIRDGGWMDQYAEQIRVAQEQNYLAATTHLWEAPQLDNEIAEEEQAEAQPLTEEEIAERKRQYSFDLELRRLKDWIRQRCEWLDKNLPEIRPTMVGMEFWDQDKMVKFMKQPSGEPLDANEITSLPKKEGFRFAGWYLRNDQGEELPISVDDPVKLGRTMLAYDARWEPYDPVQAIQGLAFSKELYYARLTDYMDLNELVSAAPFDFDKDDLEITVELAPEDCGFVSDHNLMFNAPGEAKVTFSLGKYSASCRIVAEEEPTGAKSWSLPEQLSLSVGEYAFLPLEPADGGKIVVVQDVEKPGFTLEDPSLAEIDANGWIHGLKAGTTKLTVTQPETGESWTATLTVR